MASKIQESLLRQSATVLEEWAMMMIDEPKGGLETFADGEEFLIVEMPFLCDGKPAGSTFAIAQRSLCNIVFENVLGSVEGDGMTDVHRSDAFRELLNIVTGHFVSDYFTDDAVVVLSAPTFHVAQRDEVEKIVNAESAYLIADEQPVVFTYRPN